MKGLCVAVRLSRASYYRNLAKAQPGPEALVLRDQVQKIALRYPAYGYRRVAVELRDRGYAVNHKRVLRLMRQDNLLCLRRRSFLRTTDSAHPFPVFTNLAATLRPTAVNQLWVADITYIRLRGEFVYLAVVLDVYSRRVVGWALGQSLEAELTLTALRRALAARRPAAGLVHHSDRGVQYACSDYVALLANHGIRGSMSRTGNPYDNAYAESFMKTLKYEEVYRNEYADLAEATASIGKFIDKTYNRQRLHSALGYQTPVRFERVVA